MKKRSESAMVRGAIALLVQAASDKDRDLQMPGDGRYKPPELRNYLGYDQWAGWLVIVEWFWMKVLAELGVMPESDAALLTKKRLKKVLVAVTTTKQDIKERASGGHDILALLALMREHLPLPLHRWLHYCATSYDIISTAYALQLRMVFENVFVPKLLELDVLWRKRIDEYSSILQPGRTHLQTAIPVTVGCWLANLHNRFVRNARKAREASKEIPGKFSGAVGTFASQRVLIVSEGGEKLLMKMLGLPAAEISTQIAPPEGMARFYNELVLLSGSFANLGEDTRILQSSQFGEIVSASSTSSAMSHKTANPTGAENMAGMHSTVIAESLRVILTLVSDLQRDLRGSSVMRGYSAVAVYTYYQLLTAERVLKSMEVNSGRCRKNFNEQGKLVVAELLHLFLQSEGVPEAHHVVNKEIVPRAMASGCNLYEVTGECVSVEGPITEVIWHRLQQSNIVPYLLSPEKYIGDAVEIAEREANNTL